MITKARQAAKINALGDALIEAGFRGLDAQSKALGLGRSTTWTILSGKHKTSGLSAKIINRMLAMPALPPSVRDIVLEYVEEKLAGAYGDNRASLEAFATRLTTNGLSGKGKLPLAVESPSLIRIRTGSGRQLQRF